MSEQTAREIAVVLRRSVKRTLRNATRQIMDDGGRLRMGPGGKTGVVPPSHGGTGGAPGDLPIPAGDCHDAGTLGDLLNDLFCRLAALEAVTGGYGLGPYGTTPYGE